MTTSDLADVLASGWEGASPFTRPNAYASKFGAAAVPPREMTNDRIQLQSCDLFRYNSRVNAGRSRTSHDGRGSAKYFA